MKTAIRAAAMNDVGVRLEDMLEASRSEAVRVDGRSAGLLEASKLPLRLAELLHPEVEAGKLTPEVAEAIRSWLVKASVGIESAAKNASTERLALMGRTSGLKAAVDATKALLSSETARTELVEALAKQESPPVESDDRRPPPSIKTRRLAEEVRKKAEAKPKATRGRRASHS